MFNHLVARECLTYLNDRPRNVWYRDILKDTVKDKVVFEIGIGAGILAAYALEHGAKFYYGVDVRSNRVDYTTHILNQLGYAGRFKLVDEDFLHLTADDIPQSIDILLAERTADQFCSGFNMRQFWQHANKIFSKPYVSVPDCWSMDVRVYAGKLDSDLPEYQPKLLYPDPTLPAGFYQAITSTNFVQPVEQFNQLLSFTPNTSSNSIEFILDLSAYDSATIVLNDYIHYQDTTCLSISAINDWPDPIKIVVPDARSQIKFFWNQQLRQLPAYKNGYWDYVKID